MLICYMCADGKDEAIKPMCPPHPGYMGGLCIRCGEEKTFDVVGGALSPKAAYANVEKHNDQGNHLSLNYIHHSLEVSQSEAARLREATARRARGNRKLLLVLDLDHTLLHSTRISDIGEEHGAILLNELKKQDESAPMLYHLPQMNLWTKLRPGIREFFNEARKLYDLHVFTMGDKSYAAGMAGLLDPMGELFGGRVASSSDASKGMIKDLDVLLGSDEMMVILDDTVGVWPRHKRNVIQVERYIYFPACAARFGKEGKSHVECGTDEDPANGTLASCLRVLQEAHSIFFSPNADSKNVDIRDCLSQIRSSVLQESCILFSRIIPRDVEPKTHPAWHLASELGACCTTDAEESVTHVIAGGHTSKTEWGYREGKHVVSLEWLYSSGFHWQRQEESKFSNLSQAPLRLMHDQTAAALAAAGGGSQSIKEVSQ